jgi:flagellar basal body-associated protein FliL
MLRRALIALPLILLPAAARAAEKKAETKEGEAKEVGQYVDLSPVALPIVAQGRLVNYVFVYVRINLTGKADVPRLREKEPHFRDALVRAGHRTPFTLASDYSKIDTAKLSATLQRDAAAIAGPGLIRSVVVTSQSPRRRVATPKA